MHRKICPDVRNSKARRRDTAPPAPAIARPTMSATDVGARAHINEPTRNLEHAFQRKEYTFKNCNSDEENPFYIEHFV